MLSVVATRTWGTWKKVADEDCHAILDLLTLPIAFSLLQQQYLLSSYQKLCKTAVSGFQKHTCMSYLPHGRPSCASFHFQCDWWKWKSANKRKGGEAWKIMVKTKKQPTKGQPRGQPRSVLEISRLKVGFDLLLKVCQILKQGARKNVSRQISYTAARQISIFKDAQKTWKYELILLSSNLLKVGPRPLFVCLRQ